MNDRDALDDWLRDAFQQDAAAGPPIDVTGPVLARLRQQARLRRLLLGGAVACGLALVLVWVAPALLSLLVAASAAGHVSALAGALASAAATLPALLLMALAAAGLALLD